MLLSGVKHRCDNNNEIGQLQNQVLRLSGDYQKAVKVAQQKHNECGLKDREIQKLRSEILQKEAEFRGESEHLRTRLTLVEGNLNAATADHARTVAKQNQVLEATKLALERSRDQVRSKDEDLEKAKKFMSERVPRLCRETLLDCKRVMLQKIKSVFPDADMAYFADLTDVPSDVELHPDLLTVPDDEEGVAVIEGREREESVAAPVDGEGEHSTSEPARIAATAEAEVIPAADQASHATEVINEVGTSAPINVD